MTLSAQLRRVLLPLSLLSVVAMAGAGGWSVFLETNAERAREREAAGAAARLAAALTKDAVVGRAGCLGSFLRELVASRPELVYLRVEDGQGAILAEAGDRKNSGRWLDRTYPVEGQPVRVQVGYRSRTAGLALYARASLWGVFAGVFSMLAGIVLLAVLRRRDP